VPDHMDTAFMQWFLSRVEPYRDVPAEKLSAEREAMGRQQEHNRNYAEFLNHAVLPAVEQLVGYLGTQRIVHRVSTWGNQLAIRVHLAWRWGELVITQSHEDAVTFEHHIITEGEKRNEDRVEDQSHQYDLHDPIPPIIAEQELAFFMSRLAQDLILEAPTETPPGE
jgi:hypothetical protein